MTYITNNYVTLLLLAAISMLLIINRRMKIAEMRYAWIIIGIIFMLTICEAAEDICDACGLSIKILYVKSAFVYWLYPLIAMLELYLVVPVKHKLLIAVPYFVNFVIVFIDLFDTRMVYYFGAEHNFIGGPLRTLPIAVLCFYIVMLGINSTIILKAGYRAKGIIAMFMTVTSVLTALGERFGYASGMTEEVTAAEILVYYFFLAAINYSETQEKLYMSRIELEQQRLKLLVVQMQPHFIFNSLAAIQSLCYTNSEAAADCIGVFGDYLRANIDSLASDEPISFTAELEHIEQYISLEKAGIDVTFTVIYELGIRDFKVPPLTVQPIVENAVKHGALTRRDGTGFVKIKTEKTDSEICITISDNGVGAALTSKQREHQSVGIDNVKKRLAIQCGGTLEMNITKNGSESVIKIPINEKSER